MEENEPRNQPQPSLSSDCGSVGDQLGQEGLQKPYNNGAYLATREADSCLTPS